ncbi:MAG: peroxiredoxin [Caulobacteraceae bacterium]|nr:peroxiredoxin [Caulobacteraceae bacterium]
MAAELKAGDRAPDFDLPTETGRISLAVLKGKAVVLYFYPKDDTSGCTAEAQAFTAAAGAFEKAGATVVGVSKDSIKRHTSFRSKYDLAVTLASDEAGETIERYGVWVEKSMYGRKYMGIERATLLIDKTGVVRQVWHKVKVPGHAEEVLKAAQALNG